MPQNKIVVTNVSQLNTAFSGLGSNPTSCISIEFNGAPGAPLDLITALTIPATLNTSSNTLVVEGNGVTLRAPAAGFGANVPLIKRNNGNSVDLKSVSLVFRNITFDCRNVTNQLYGLELFNCSNVIVDNCKFLNCKIGLNMANVDRAAISNCLAYNVTSAGYVCGIDGAFPGNTNATACNDITYTNCKFQNISTSTAIGFKAEATVGLSYYECSVQGTVKDGISFDSRGGNAGISGPGVPNTINNLQIRNFRIAYADDAMIYLKLFTGFVKIDGLYVTGPSRYVIHAEAVAGSTENPHLYVENLPYLLNTSIFKTTGGIPASNVCNTPAPDPTVVWEFKEVYDGQNIFGAARWDSGLIPYYRYAEFFNESKKILTNSISINNKFI